MATRRARLDDELLDPARRVTADRSPYDVLVAVEELVRQAGRPRDRERRREPRVGRGLARRLVSHRPDGRRPGGGAARRRVPDPARLTVLGSGDCS